jgi:tetratricopeptide (TPR) repeat protein
MNRLFAFKATVSTTLLCILLSTGLLLITGCSSREEHSALYILEEYEAAAAVDDPEARLERLNIFVQNHGSHPYRANAYRTIFETYAVDIGDVDEALKYVERVLAEETEFRMRGDLLLAKFKFFWNLGRDKGAAIASDLLDSDETYYRMFLLMGFYLMGDEEYCDLSARCFEKAHSLGSNEAERSNAMAAYGELLIMMGREDEALVALQKATLSPFAKELLAKMLWEQGKREEALTSWIGFVAAVPGAYEEIRLDSLYSLVYTESDDLDKRIWAARLIDEGPLPDHSFTDIEGRSYKLSELTGTTLVINIWHPT